jgi:molybdopterin-guanine dinucleotide biosynthesis protein A
MNITVGILVGGQSRRMGRPKGLIRVGGVTLLERTLGVARAVSESVVLLGQPPFDLPPGAAGLPVLPDARPGLGPIGGLAALLSAYPRDPAILLACDLPRLSPALLERLVDALDCEVDAVAYARAEETVGVAHPTRWEPCCAAYMPSVRTVVERQIEAGDFSLQSLLERVRTRTLTLDAAEAALLTNVNEPVDLVGLDD